MQDINIPILLNTLETFCTDVFNFTGVTKSTTRKEMNGKDLSTLPSVL